MMDILVIIIVVVFIPVTCWPTSFVAVYRSGVLLRGSICPQIAIITL